MEDQLDWLSAAGSSDADCWYEENRRAVLGGTWLLFRGNYLYLRELRESYVSGAATIALIPPLDSFDLRVSGPRVGNDVHLSSFSLLGNLQCRAFGEFLKVTSEVNVQCFFCLVWDHFLASDEEISRTAAWQLSIQTAILLVPLHRVPPPKESMKGVLENRCLLISIAV